MTRYDLILSHVTDYEKTAEILGKYLDSLSDGHIKLMLKEVPLRVLHKEGEFHVKRLAEALGMVGCTVKLIPSA